LSGDVLALVSVLSEVQVIYQADATATPSPVAALKLRMGFLADAILLSLSWERRVHLYLLAKLGQMLNDFF